MGMTTYYYYYYYYYYYAVFNMPCVGQNIGQKCLYISTRHRNVTGGIMFLNCSSICVCVCTCMWHALAQRFTDWLANHI